MFIYMQYFKNENIMIESVLGVWHWTVPDRSRPLGGEADHTFGKHGVLGIFDNSFGLRTKEKQGLCVPFWNEAEERGPVASDSGGSGVLFTFWKSRRLETSGFQSQSSGR